MLFHFHAEIGRERGEPFPVFRRRNANRVARQLFLGQPFGILAAGLDQCVNESVAILRRHARKGVRTEIVAALLHALEQSHGRCRGVQADGISDTRMFGRISRQHQGDPAFGRRCVAQPRVRERDPGDPAGAFRIGHIARQAVGVDFLEGERNRDEPAIELRHRHLVPGVQRGQTFVVVLPGLAIAGQAERLQDRYVERGQFGDVPGFVVATGANRGRPRATGREHRDQERVRCA